MNAIATPVVGLTVAVFVLALLVLRTKVHPFIAMLAAACIAGLTAGLSATETLESLTRGFGATLGSIGIVIGLGVMMGRILEISGAAEQIAFSFIRFFGKGKEAWAMVLAGYFISIPIFVDSAFVILYPIVKALAQKGNRSVLTLGVALAGGLVITHTAVPPTPGPLGAAGIFGVDVGAMMLLGMALAIPCAVVVVMYAQWLEKKYFDFNQTLRAVDLAVERIEPLEETRKPPALLLSWLPVAVPIVLILIKAVLGFFPSLMLGGGKAIRFSIQVFYFLGSPIIALSVATVLAVYTLVPWLDRKKTNARMEEGLQSAGIILLVTGAGGALGAVIRDSGAGTTLATHVSNLPVSPVMIPFFVATIVRLVQGSGTVACITSASITAPVLAQVPQVNMLFAAQAAVMGALCFSYFNDSLFWVVNRMMGIRDMKQQIMVWSLPTTLAWGTGGVSVAMVNMFFGAGGTIWDPLLPLTGLAAVFFIMLKK
jgi:GntP family gluconate:H+ symporter